MPTPHMPQMGDSFAESVRNTLPDVPLLSHVGLRTNRGSSESRSSGLGPMVARNESYAMHNSGQSGQSPGLIGPGARDEGCSLHGYSEEVGIIPEGSGSDSGPLIGVGPGPGGLPRITLLETVWKLAVRVGWRLFWWREEPKRCSFAPFRRLVVPRSGAYSEFPDSLWKGYSPKFVLASGPLSSAASA